MVERGDMIRVCEGASGVPTKLEGAQMEVAETIEIAGKTHVRVRDPFVYTDGSTGSATEHAPPAAHCPFTIVESDYEVIEDE